MVSDSALSTLSHKALATSILSFLLSMIDSSVTEGVTYIPDQHLKGHSEYVQSELLCSLDC